MNRVTCALLAVLVMGAGVAATVSAQTQAPVYDVAWTAGPAGEEQTYTGTVTFAVDAKGVVTGALNLTSPATVKANLSGTVDKGIWSFEYDYQIVEQGCTGRLKGTATVPADRGQIKGKAQIWGDCAPQGLDSTFTFTAKKQ